MTLLRTVLLNAMDPILPVEQGSAANITLTVELLPGTAQGAPEQAKRIKFEAGAACLELSTLLEALRDIMMAPDDAPDHAEAINLARAGLHDQAAVAFLRLATRGDAAVIALYGMAAQLARAGKLRQARQVGQFLATIWDDDPRPLALLGTIQAALSATRDARNSLAMAAHLSRRNPSFRGVLRYSQRELLKLQFHDQVEPSGRGD